MNANYVLKEKRELPEISSTGYWYIHTSGANILHVANNDTNKVFDVTFRTPPYNDTGLPHILEHCVLNGSETYPLKDPFWALMKGSLVTFLNAMTFPDMTRYPVASYNDKDFLNLMGVYLDAVYKPLIHKREHAFLQEGWHYSLDSRDGELGINGVVYNEMKGASSNPDVLLRNRIMQTMFPESHYRFNSGGDPAAIPQLTYEQFKDFHRTLYHPSNSFVYLYGDMDADECFALLDSYLCDPRFTDNTRERSGVNLDRDMPLQRPFGTPVFSESRYSIAAGFSPQNRNYLGASYVLGDYPSPLMMYSLVLMDYILMDTPASPLRNALLEKGMGESVNSLLNLQSRQPQYMIFARNSGHSALELKECIETVLRGIVNDGFDPVFIESCLNAIEFRYREKAVSYAPKGLIYMTDLGHGWVYGYNPMDYLSPVSVIADIRGRLASGERYFERLIQDLIPGNNYAGFVTLKAVPGLQAENELKLKEQLSAYKSSLSESQLDAIISKKAALTELQNQPESPEVQESIPIVSLSDIKKPGKAPEISEKVLNGTKILFADIVTDGIIYANMQFNLRCLSKNEVPVAGILIHLLGKLDTRNRSYGELNNELNLHLGGFECGVMTYGHRSGTDYLPALEIRIKALENKLPHMFKLAAEILTETLFNDKARVKMLLSEVKTNMEQRMISAGNYFGSTRAMSYLGENYAHRDLVEGYGFYDYLSELLNSFNTSFESLKELLYAVSVKLFGRNHANIAVACEERAYPKAEELIGDFLNVLPAGRAPAQIAIGHGFANEAFVVESMVNYCVQAFSFLDKGMNFSGLTHVLENVIKEGYFLQELRVKGGAYGYGISIRRDGAALMHSYRDPHLQRTYNVYKTIPAFLEAFKPADREMLQYVLGAVNRLDAPVHPREQFNRAVTNYLTGATAEMLQTEREQLLSANSAQIRSFAPVIEKCLNSSSICTFGSNASISEHASIFDRVVKMK